MSDWQWTQRALLDGDVEIVWAVQDHKGKLYLGVFEDYAEAIRRVPDLIEALRDVRADLGLLVENKCPLEYYNFSVLDRLLQAVVPDYAEAATSSD